MEETGRAQNLLVLLMLLLSVTVPAFAQHEEASQFFQQGNERYAEGAYTDAVLLYQQARASGYTSGALYHNMGNAYFRQDSLGQAIRYYEKALRYLPDDVQLRHNLQIARARTLDTFPTVPEPAWKPWWTRLVLTVGALGLFVAGFVFYLVGVLLTAYRLRTATRKPWVRRTRAVAVLLGSLFLIAAFAASVTSSTHDRAVILAEEVTLHEAPATDAASLRELHEGTVLEVLQAQDGWQEVRLPNGETGWLPTDVIGEI